MTSDDAQGTAHQASLLASALGRVPTDQLRAALSSAPAVPPSTATAARNAWNALRRHRDPAAVFDRAQYRAALPSVAAAVSDECLARTVEALGEHSDDPTRQQLLEALEEVRTSFPDTTVAVMLASVACDHLPSSGLCAEVLAEDARFGLAGAGGDGTDGADIGEAGGAPASQPPVVVAEQAGGPSPGAGPEQRAARRAKREKVKAERRRKAEVARRADDRVRQRRKVERARSSRRPPQSG